MTDRYFVLSQRKLRPSSNGYPRYKFVAVNRFNEVVVLHTAPNHKWVTNITDWTNRMIEAITHETSRNTIMDRGAIAEVF